MHRNVIWAVIGSLAALLNTAAGQAPSAAQTSPFVGTEVCKECHEPYSAAWKNTKHWNTFARLEAAEREKVECLKCHVTGTPELIAAELGKPSLPGVQCEACHGAGRAHVEAARAGDVKKGLIVGNPDEKNCKQCHNEASPHYRPFFYGAMAPLVHRVKK
jgi:hypothetical protein